MFRKILTVMGSLAAAMGLSGIGARSKDRIQAAMSADRFRHRPPDEVRRTIRRRSRSRCGWSVAHGKRMARKARNVKRERARC